MGRKARGTVYESSGSIYLAITLDKRRHFRLEACSSKQEAELRQDLIVNVAQRLKKAGRVDTAIRFCEQASTSNEVTLAKLIQLMEGLLGGSEELESRPAAPSKRPMASMTVSAFGELWTSNELAKRYRGRVRRIDHKDNKSRLDRYVYPVAVDGRTVGDTPLDELTIDHADEVLSQANLPAGSLRHVAQCLNRMFTLAVYPARVLKHSPLPRGWMPAPNRSKAKSYLFPAEDAAVLAYTAAPLVTRVLLGFLSREGPRKGNVASLRWSDLTLDLPGGRGYAVIDRTKSGADGRWVLAPGTAEALRRWRRLCPSEQLVFPAEAVPRSPRRNHGKPMNVDKLGENLRKWLRAVGVNRPQLFESTNDRLQLRAHDLRVTFVTLSLANGETEDWVRRRTGHKSSTMIALYRQDADTYGELNLGPLTPLYKAIPELASLPVDDVSSSDALQRHDQRGVLRVVGG